MSSSCSTQRGLFDFMANQVGIRVLHPGGYGSTRELLSMCDIDENSHVLDLACGVGTTSFYMHSKYGCKVTGIDISGDFIDVARRSLGKKGRSGSVTFDVGSALELPYADETFDAVISQAFFILIDEKKQALTEAARVLKPGGHFGALELSWFETPSDEAFTELREKTCDFIPRVVTFDAWQQFFESAGFSHIATSKHPMKVGVVQMFRTEGFLNATRIMLKMVWSSTMRARMMEVQSAFNKHCGLLGYGLYSFRNEAGSAGKA